MGNIFTLVTVAVWYTLVVIGDWMLFRKAGKPGWHSLIPFLNMIDEFDLCWNGAVGFFYALLTFVATTLGNLAQANPIFLPGAGLCLLPLAIMRWIESRKLAASFDKGLGFTFILFFFGGLGRMILGLSSAEYVGKNPR